MKKVYLFRKKHFYLLFLLLLSKYLFSHNIYNQYSENKYSSRLISKWIPKNYLEKPYKFVEELPLLKNERNPKLSINPIIAINSAIATQIICNLDSSAPLTVSVTDAGNFTYQWYRSNSNAYIGIPIPGATNFNFQPSGFYGDSVYYYVIVKNSDTNEESASSIYTIHLDSDLDGVPNFNDFDSDNDGIFDNNEITACTNPSFKNNIYFEDFGKSTVQNIRQNSFTTKEGTSELIFKNNNPTSDSHYSITTNSTLVDDFGAYTNQWSKDLNIANTALLSNGYEDKTNDGLGNYGYMAIFNPQNNTNVIWRSPTLNVKKRAAIEVKLNLMRLNSNQNNPNLTIQLYNATTNTAIGSALNTGEFVSRGIWQEKSIIISLGTNINASNIYVRITSQVNSGQGNDFALDDIEINELYCDSDNDGIPNYLDLDSDNDGCVDAIEGGENIKNSQLVNASSCLTVGINSSAKKRNLCNGKNCVDINGIPLIISDKNNGQNIGSSINVNLRDTDCSLESCFKLPQISGAFIPTTNGISSIRIKSSDNWPMERNGGFIALESKTKGFVINRIPTTAALSTILNPIEGMMVFNEQAKCLKVYTSKENQSNFSWYCMTSPSCPD